MTEPTDDTYAPPDCDADLMSDFDDWLEVELPRMRMGVTWVERDHATVGTSHADWLAGDENDRLRYAIVETRADQLPASMDRLKRLAQAGARDAIFVLASPDWLPVGVGKGLPRPCQLWDARYWWRNRWEYIRIGAWRPATAHLRQQVAQRLLTNLAEISPGHDGQVALNYQRLAMAMVMFTYGHQLRFPREEIWSQDRAQRRDGMFANHATNGPWAWLVKHGYHAPTIILEAKNDSGSLRSPRISELAAYLGPRRAGSVGILACRKAPGPRSPAASHLTTLARDGVLILPFDDQLFRFMVEACAVGGIDAVDEAVYEIIWRIRDPM